ncbi:MAG: coproporphyrinogen dehydrogenase HemZ [Clostridiaceae bacterium]|nr:coproporphyrinogen dehydrogenase HemZ [Clostridiaceae bacterium]
MQVILENHQEYQSIAEILRLFFLEVGKLESGIISVTDPEYSDIIIYSVIEREVSTEQMRNQADQTEILVQSRIADSNLSIKAQVVPSAIRREIKRQMYYLLSELINIHYPWGSLTGVRPTQIAYRSFLENQQDRDRTIQDLVDNWYVAPEKAEIGLKTAITEAEILSDLESELPMLYLGVPFCTTRCSYCSFITQDAVNLGAELDIYVQALLQEIIEISDYFKRINKPFQAIYMGGGTPTALSDQGFAQVINAIKEQIPQTENCEITVEAGRPDSITSAKLAAIKTISGARICINPQTMHDQTLQIIGRKHSVNDVYQAYKLARVYNFSSINMDLILGLPGETGEDFLYSLEKILELAPESITIHTMALKRSAFLQQQHAAEYLKLRFPDRELSDVFNIAIKKLAKQNYQPYYLYRQKNVRGGLENIGFAKPGYACIYNIGMMSDRISVVGLGSGSSSKRVNGDRLERIFNPKDLANYVERLAEIIQRKLDFFA